MYKLVISLLSFVFFSFLSAAQMNELDEIHIQGDTSYRGRVIEQKPGEYIKLVHESTGDTLTFEMEEIDKLVRVPVRSSMAKEDQAPSLTASRIFNDHPFTLSISGSVGGGDVSFSGLGIGANYRATDRMMVGVSAHYYGETGSSTRRPYQWQKLPITADLTYELQSHFGNRSAIFAHLGVGYAFTLNGDFRSPDTGEDMESSNGICLNPGLGYRLNIFKNTGVNLEVSYLLITDKVTNMANTEVDNNQWDNVKFSASIFF